MYIDYTYTLQVYIMLTCNKQGFAIITLFSFSDRQCAGYAHSIQYQSKNFVRLCYTPTSKYHIQGTWHVISCDRSINSTCSLRLWVSTSSISQLRTTEVSFSLYEKSNVNSNYFYTFWKRPKRSLYSTSARRAMLFFSFITLIETVHTITEAHRTTSKKEIKAKSAYVHFICTRYKHLYFV